MKRILGALIIFLVLAIVSSVYSPAYAALPQIRVNSGGRYLETVNGQPFFYLADTAWELFHRLSREDAELYLENRKQKGYTVIQAVALAEQDGLTKANVYGDLPLNGTDPSSPKTTSGNNPANSTEYDYWDHVDWIINKAEEKGMYVGLLPTWGDKVYYLWGPGPQVFNTTNARNYGRFIGARYKDKTNIIWIMGGDRDPVGDNGTDYRPVWNAMVEGIIEGMGHDGLFTYHPQGYHGPSGQWLHNTSWLDFNAFQSGHEYFDAPVWQWTQEDYNRSPAKPIFDIEANYEDHPRQRDPNKGWFRDHDVRKQSYRSVFAGGHGITYGHHAVWQFYTSGVYSAINYPDRNWKEAIDRPGAGHMQHLKNLMLSRPFFTRVPDQSLITSGSGDGGTHVRATRSSDGSYAFVYIPTANQSVTVDMNKLSGSNVRAWWYNPRTGQATEIGTYPRSGTRSFTSPSSGPDSVLVLDDVSRNFGTPGSGVSTPAPTSTPTPTPTVAPTATPTPLPGDANGDGKVDGLDYVRWLNNYNRTTTAGASAGDFNGDGKVDGLDYVRWLNNYGRTGGPTTNPTATATPTQAPTSNPTSTPNGTYPRELTRSAGDSRIAIMETQARSGNTVYVKAQVDPSVTVVNIHWYVNGGWTKQDNGSGVSLSLPSNPSTIRAVVYYNTNQNFIEASTNYSY